MKLTVERDVLHDAVVACGRRAKGGAAIPILSYLLIEAGAEGLTVTGNDLDSCTTIAVSAEVARPGAVAIPSERLRQLTAGLPTGGTVVTEVIESVAQVRCGRSNYKLPTLPATDFPALLAAKDDAVSFEVAADHVRKLLDEPSVSVEPVKGRIYLAGICLHPSKGGITAVATNGHTMVKVTANVECPKFEKIIIPEVAAKEIVSLVKTGAATFTVSPSLISVKYGAITYVSKLVDATYPDYERVIPPANGNPIKVDGKGLDASLARLVAACDPEKAAIVKLSWADGNDLTASLRSQFGAGEGLLEAEIGERAPGEIGANIRYLRDLLGVADGDVVDLHIGGPGEAIRIENPNRRDFLAVCMPCAL